jgi:hypothetical protein
MARAEHGPATLISADPSASGGYERASSSTNDNALSTPKHDFQVVRMLAPRPKCRPATPPFPSASGRRRHSPARRRLGRAAAARPRLRRTAPSVTEQSSRPIVTTWPLPDQRQPRNHGAHAAARPIPIVPNGARRNGSTWRDGALVPTPTAFDPGRPQIARRRGCLVPRSRRERWRWRDRSSGAESLRRGGAQPGFSPRGHRRKRVSAAQTPAAAFWQPRNALSCPLSAQLPTATRR